MPIHRNTSNAYDDYRTPQCLIQYIHGQILPSLNLELGTQFYDPAAGDGRLLAPITYTAVHNFDINPRVDVIRQDFLRDDIVRPDVERLCVVMNPPYRDMPVKFLNQLARRIMRAGEYCVAIMPVTMSAWTRIGEVNPCMHLVQQHIPPRKVLFKECGDKGKRIAISVQVWQLHNTPMRRFPAEKVILDKEYDPGEFIYRTSMPKVNGRLNLAALDFVIKRNTTVRDLGTIIHKERFTHVEETKATHSQIIVDTGMTGSVRTSGGGTFTVIRVCHPPDASEMDKSERVERVRRRFECIVGAGAFISWYGELGYACCSLPPTRMLKLLYRFGPQPLDKFGVCVVHIPE